MARIKGLWALLAGVDDPTEREDLALVATAIQVHFVNRVVHERAVVEFMSIRFRWAGSKTRRRLDSLVELGVLRCTRDLADNWTKVFEVVDRPAVPAALAVELGAGPNRVPSWPSSTAPGIPTRESAGSRASGNPTRRRRRFPWARASRIDGGPLRHRYTDSAQTGTPSAGSGPPGGGTRCPSG